MLAAVARPGGAAKVSVNGNSSSAATGRGKTFLMNDDTRLGDGLGPLASPQGSAAARNGTQAGPTSGSSVYAALDLGTNNCRLLIACPTDDGFRVVDSFSRIIRLGEGISATGSISDAAIERAITALCICRDKIQSRKARRLRLIATEACRAASNAAGFRDRVAAETGIQLEVINRETEAALAVIGCSPLLDPKGRGLSCSTSAGGRPNWFGSSVTPTSKTPYRVSRGGCPYRSASSPWPSSSAAGTSRRNPMRRWCGRSRSTSRRSRPSTAAIWRICICWELREP